ncbi:hypothetical protein [Tenggerimyces flavus]|uniref:Fido domain-containing protein n=1 Tax=Tenggerimyces flavus TaxID=1708749 RepID=A0ABV7YF39_9ACTN|nr:hypothetical protein [Tenggerimyces flavus]MBM7789124.1 prophage maintenance system killer protein [Tenggerimyces flavus]
MLLPNRSEVLAIVGAWGDGEDPVPERRRSYNEQLDELSAMRRRVVALPDGSEKERLLVELTRRQARVEAFRTETTLVEARHILAEAKAAANVAQADLEAIEAALGEARAEAERSDDLAEVAATLLRGLLRHRPFPSDNREIAVVVMLHLLAWNGRDLDPGLEERLESIDEHAPRDLAELRRVGLRERPDPST